MFTLPPLLCYISHILRLPREFGNLPILQRGTTMTATLTTFLQWLTVLTVTGGGLGPPLGIPPAAQDPVMERVAPEQCLFYASWAGVAKADPKSRNQTEQLVAEPEVKNFTG